MRVLIATDPPLSPEYGASSLALGLGEGLRAQGHDAVLRSAATPPAGDSRALSGGKWLAALLRAEGPFDVVDASAACLAGLSVPPGVIRVARSVQPQWLYERVELRAAVSRLPLRPSTWRALLGALRRDRLIRRGWLDAERILCLGSLELEWMRATRPDLAPRLGKYVAAPLGADRHRFRRVRAERFAQKGADRISRLLWIGRWTAHKGTEVLLNWLRSAEFRALDATVTLAGCGDPAESILEPFIRKESVRVIPSFSRDELPAILATHHAGLHTSVVEGWGLALQEMLESGMPVFARESGAVPDLGEHLSDLLRPFPPASASTVAVSVDWSEYESKFDWGEIARGYVEGVVTARAES